MRGAILLLRSRADWPSRCSLARQSSARSPQLAGPPSRWPPRLDVVAFYELIGLLAERVPERLADAEQFIVQAQHAAGWRGGISPHAPYSVHPELVVGLIRRATAHRLPLAMHLAESREELELLAAGSGPFRSLLEELGAWDPSAFPHGTRPLEYLQLLAEAPRSLVIHGNYLEVDELEFLAMNPQRMSIVYCPRTHAYFEHARHPLPRLMALGASVALGTDSRASNPDLSLLAEMRFVAQRYPEIARRPKFCGWERWPERRPWL